MRSSRIVGAPGAVSCGHTGLVVDGVGPGVEDIARPAAVRASRRRDLGPDPELPIGRARARAGSVPGDDTAGRSLTDDLTAAVAPLDRFTRIWRGSAA